MVGSTPVYVARFAITVAALGILWSCSKSETKAPTPAAEARPVGKGGGATTDAAAETVNASVRPYVRDPAGSVLVAVTIDWEGAFLSDDGLDVLDAFRRRMTDIPITHFVSAAYFTKQNPDKKLDPAEELAAQVKPTDELAIHLHAWASLARAAKIDVHLAPSFVTGKDKLVAFPDGDVGLDSDLDNYSVAELRAMLATSRQLLTAAKLPLSTSFRAGGYLGTRKVLEAARAEGLVVDSSAVDHRQLENDPVLRARLAKVWPAIDSTSQPYTIDTPAGAVHEIPIAVFVEDANTAELVDLVKRAHQRLVAAPGKDVVVVFGFHQETAHEFVPTLLDAIEKVRADPALRGRLQFTTVATAATATTAAK